MQSIADLAQTVNSYALRPNSADCVGGEKRDTSIGEAGTFLARLDNCIFLGRGGLDHLRKLDPIRPKNSLALTTSVARQRLGKCRLLPVTRKSAPAASAHSKKRLSGSSGDTEMVCAGAARILADRSTKLENERLR